MIEKTKGILQGLGGIRKIHKDLGMHHLHFYVADQLDCTLGKAKEYVSMAIQGAIARAKIEQYVKDQESKSKVQKA